MDMDLVLATLFQDLLESEGSYRKQSRNQLHFDAHHFEMSGPTIRCLFTDTDTDFVVYTY